MEQDLASKDVEKWEEVIRESIEFSRNSFWRTLVFVSLRICSSQHILQSTYTFHQNYVYKRISFVQHSEITEKEYLELLHSPYTPPSSTSLSSAESPSIAEETQVVQFDAHH